MKKIHVTSLAASLLIGFFSAHAAAQEAPEAPQAMLARSAVEGALDEQIAEVRGQAFVDAQGRTYLSIAVRSAALEGGRSLSLSHMGAGSGPEQATALIGDRVVKAVVTAQRAASCARDVICPASARVTAYDHVEGYYYDLYMPATLPVAAR